MKVTRHPRGPRVYILGLRVHHGLTGTVLIVAGWSMKSWPVVELGIVLVADDLHDFPWSPIERQR